MDQREIGKFIAACRKQKNLTQAQLAERLNITDRAVSKWETGKSMPDSSIMLPLCQILGITVNELLSGEALGGARREEKAEENLLALKRSGEAGPAGRAVLSLLFSAAVLAGIVVCLICDIATSGRLTWSPIPVASLVFAWAVTFPGLLLRRRGITASLLSLSVFILPYLFSLSGFTNVEEVFSIGSAAAVPSVIFLWIAAAVFHRAGKERTLAALGIVFLAAVPFQIVLNAILSNLIGGPVLDMWDLLSVFLLLTLACAAFLCDRARKNRSTRS